MIRAASAETGQSAVGELAVTEESWERGWLETDAIPFQMSNVVAGLR